ncbi:MAG: hypothetical protein LBP19_09675 [Treponema sp.]|jgi:NAD-dependent SIR2 family protein deacetylase|nr:hypothetical protein [Treponema sp.]
MGIWEKLGGAIGALANDDFEQALEKYGSAVDELFSSEGGNNSPQPRKWYTTCKKCGQRFQQIHATIEPENTGIYSCPGCGQEGPTRNPNGWYNS